MQKVTKGIKSFGLPRVIIMAFFLLLLVVAGISGMNVPSLMGDAIRRWTMYGILVLAMVPSIKCGIGPNFGITLGIEGGLVGALISIEMRSNGYFDSFTNPVANQFVGVFVAIAFGLIISSLIGIAYGWLLNRVKGSEMTIATYVGFSVVALMNIMWLLLPFRSSTSIWPLGGEGLRNQINLDDDFSGVFSDFLSFKIGGVTIPTGMLVVFFLACFLVWLFTRSRVGTMMTAAGANPTYAKAAGINVDKMRILGTTISTALGAVGIICYAQSYGFLQLYNGPQMMGFACVAAVLIGGATISKASIFNVILGTFLFQGIMAVALPVANQLLPDSSLSDVIRIIISNGIILYALSKAKEASK